MDNVEYEAWEPYYLQILKDFRFSREKDEAVAAELDRILGGTRATDAQLRDAFEGKIVTVAGNGPNLAENLSRARGVLVTADEATSVVLEKGLRPAAVVTDLDGDVSDQIRANAEGAIALVHGHGDNGPAIRLWAPRFPGLTVATTQSRPSGRLRNFGGFTDGDRAVFLADHFGASEIRLVGFDFDRPNAKDESLARKRHKLTWAYILLQNLGRPELVL